MLRFLTLTAIAILSFGAIKPALADTSIAVIDMQQILSESDAAKSILSQMKVKRDGLEKEIKSLEDKLKASEGELIKKKETLKPEEFAAARKEFEKKLIESRTKVQKDRNAADAAFNGAINELRKNLVEVVSQLATEKKIQLVITKQNVVIGDNSLEITKDVMTKLNAKIKTIKVN